MFSTIVTAPLYNALIFLVDVLPNHDLWIAMVILTVGFKTLLVPLFKKQARDMIVIQFIAPKVKELQDKYKDKREVLARETMSLYSKYKVNPLTQIFMMFIQFPFIIGLYQIFYYGINEYTHLLYSGVSLPENLNTMFFGIHLSEKSLLLAFLAGFTQYILGLYMFKKKNEKEQAAETEFVRAMNMQMKYFLPVVMAIGGYVTSSVVSLYLIVTNLYGIGQEIVIKGPLEKQVRSELETM